MKLNKKQHAVALYQANHSLPRKELIELVMKELNTTENSARTHISNASKELNATLGKSYATRNTLKASLKKERARGIIMANHASMTRKDLADKLVKEAGLKTLSSAQTHISRILKENGI